MTALIDIATEPRLCEGCGGSALESVWSSRNVVRKASADYRFHVYLVVCRVCGYCFTSPGATADALARYYADGLTSYKGIGLAYSIERRMTVLEGYRNSAGVFAEVGGDQPDEFHQHAATLFGTVLNVDVAVDISAGCRSVEDLPVGAVDVLAHYEVIEHVPGVERFLRACACALKEGGIMICETPDLRLYPLNLILSEFEHVNHFSALTLASIARRCGLELIEVSHQCSRPHSFLSIYRKAGHLTHRPAVSFVEYFDAVACVRGGVEQIRRVQEQATLVQQRLTELGSQGRSVTLWGVTDLLRGVLEGTALPLPATTVVVDSDPRRKTHLQKHGVTVFEPKDCKDHIASTELFVLCAARYQAEILDWVYQHTGRQFGTDELVVLGRGTLGASLL